LSTRRYGATTGDAEAIGAIAGGKDGRYSSLENRETRGTRPAKVMNRKRLSIVVCPLMVLMLLCACERNRRHELYRVIGRTNSDAEVVYEVPVVLERNGHKYYAKCNNIKAVENPKVTQHCELHVGMKVECQFFANRDVNGYDLICGSKRDPNGNLDTYGENKLLSIEKEEN
jgi:hypothetical protein